MGNLLWRMLTIDSSVCLHVCIVMSILSFSFLTGKSSVQQTSPEDESQGVIAGSA